MVRRVFAADVFMTPSEYSEVESGVVGWIEEKQKRAIEDALLLNKEERSVFRELLKLARRASRLTFDKIFSREMLTPARSRCVGDNQLSEKEQKELLDAIFTPLPGAEKLTAS